MSKCVDLWSLRNFLDISVSVNLLESDKEKIKIIQTEIFNPLCSLQQHSLNTFISPGENKFFFENVLASKPVPDVVIHEREKNQEQKLQCFCPFKGTGTRDLIWLKVVSLDRSWLVGLTDNL